LYRTHVSLSVVLSAALALVAALSCGKNHAADVPTVPAGRDSCFTDTTYTFTTIPTDPDGDSVAVRFDWGDSTLSDWSILVASGDTVALTHAWSDTGTHEVRAQARDKSLQSSDWSAALAVRVVVARPAPDAPAEPDGPAKGGQDSTYSFATVAFHPESMDVAIRFAWGDGDTSQWSEFVAPGESVSMSHTWPVPDTYAVAAQAKDTGNAMSQWSVPHSIRIRMPDTLRLWRYRLTALEGGSFYSSPAFGPDGNIYVGSIDSALYSIRPDSTLRWRYSTGGVVRSSPAIAPDGTVYVGSYDNVLYAINSDGTLRWSYATDGSIYASPAIGANGIIYFGSLDHWFYAINPDGARSWRTLANKAGRSSPAVAADDTVYVGSDDDNICRVNPNGAVKWEYKTGGTIHASPSLGADGTVYCGSGDGNLYALNPDGSLKWKFLTDSTIQGSAIIASDGTIYFGSADNSVYALNTDGTAKWQFESDGAIQSSPTLGPDGKLYFTSKDGHLYALKGRSPLAGSPWPKFHHDPRNTGRVGGGR
jgi:outer membrane protein assembly factor BamB